MKTSAINSKNTIRLFIVQKYTKLFVHKLALGFHLLNPTIYKLFGKESFKNSTIFVSMKNAFYVALIVVTSLIGLTSCDEKPPVEITKATPSNIDSLLNLYPDSVELLLMRGTIAIEDYRYEEALADAARAFRLDSNKLEVRMLFAQCQNDKPTRTVADVASAQRHFKYILKKEPENTKALVALATTYGYQQDFETAFKYVNKALRIDPKFRDAYVFKGTMYLLMEDYKSAKSSYETAIQQDPDFFVGYLRLGAIYQAENDPICLEYFTTANKLEPKNPEGIYALAYAHEQFNQFSQAKELYREMARTDSSDYYISRGLFHIAYIQQFQENKLDSAIYYYTSAIETDGLYVEAFHNRGMCFESKGNIEAALKNYAKALDINPGFQLSREAAEKHRGVQ